MREELAAVYDELLRRQASGEKDIFLSEEALGLMREFAQSAKEEPAPAKPARKKPVPRKKAKVAIEVPDPPEVILPEGDKTARWEALRERVLADPWCTSQVKPGKKVVLGVGSLEARIFFCGEAPGEEEEIQGEPFVGPAGQLLTKIIQAMGLQRGDAYIGNIMNYRPPMPVPVGNRPPELEEMAYCLPYLKAQLEIVQPEVIIALGNTAVEGLLGSDPNRRIGKIRGKWFEYEGIPLIPTYHPSFLLRNQSLSMKRLVWEDMLSVMDRLEMPVSEKQRQFFLK